MERVYDVVEKKAGILWLRSGFPYLLTSFLSRKMSAEELESFNCAILVEDMKKGSLFLCAMGEVSPAFQHMPVEDTSGYFVRFPSQITPLTLISLLENFKGDPEKLLERIEELIKEEELKEYAQSPAFLLGG